MKAVLAALVLLAAPALADAPAADGPAVGAVSFYDVYLAQHGAGGIPDATGRARYAAVVSPALNALMTQAAAAQARTAARIKSAGPKAAVMPMLQGDIFTSLFEGATGYKVGECRGDASAARCTIALTRLDAKAKPGARPAAWHDTLVMTRTAAGWKVDDVVYDIALPDGNTGRLTEMLRMVIASNP
jgi:hypothetical protein